MRRFLLALSVAAVLALPSAALADRPEPKVALCHLTSSETNVYVYKEVDASAVDKHLEHGDVLTTLGNEASCDL